MSDLPFEKDAAGAILTRLNAAKAGLGHPYEGRWKWWRKLRKVARVLVETTPAVVTQYNTAKRGVSDAYGQVRRTRRRHLSWLWLRIFFASIWAVIRRARVALLAVFIIGAIGGVTYIYGPMVLQYLSELSAQDSPADQTTPTPQTTSPPQALSANPPPSSGRDAPSQGPR